MARLLMNIQPHGIKKDSEMEGTEKVPFGIKDLKNFFKTIF